jgi:E3 ubiquitin-protein ligase SHPRH
MANDPPGFWQKVDHEEDPAAFAYRRITGDLQSIPIAGPSFSRPVPHVDPESQGLVEELLAEEDEMAFLPMLLDLSGVRGTMLCEEMGESSFYL